MTQSEDPNNYREWTTIPGAILSYENGDAGRLYNNGIKTWRNVKSKAFVWQGYLMDSLIVPTIGWRRDEFKGTNVQAPKNARDQVNPSDPDWKIDEDQPLVAGESISYSVVVHSPSWVAKHLPLGTHFDVFYNRSENFQPRPGERDMFNQPLANPLGKTKDYGFVVSTLDDRLSFKINWYETKVANDRLQGFEFWRIPGVISTMMSSSYRVRNKDVGNPWKWDYSSWTNNGGQAGAEAGAQAVLDAYNSSKVFKDFADSWGLAPYLNQEGGYFNVPPGITATTDSTSKGVEFEVSAEPVKGWSLSFNASKTKATQQNIGGALKEWIEVLDPIMNGPAGDLRQWWAGDSNNFRSLWGSEVMSQFNRLKAQEETNVPELRPWRFNIVTNYSFNNEVFGGYTKGLNVGGAYRWEDKSVIGYPVIMQTNSVSGNTEYVYDVKHPWKGPSESHLDLWVGYGRKNVFRGIDWRVQLNLRDVLAKKELIPISVQPDGTPAAYRIPSLTSWSVTNTFEF